MGFYQLPKESGSVKDVNRELIGVGVHEVIEKIMARIMVREKASRIALMEVQDGKLLMFASKNALLCFSLIYVYIVQGWGPLG